MHRSALELFRSEQFFSSWSTPRSLRGGSTGPKIYQRNYIYYFQSKNGINLLYSETVKCFRREWLLPNDHESDEMLQKRLYNSETNPTDENKKAFINLARSQKYFSCFQFGPCFWLVNNNFHI